jgi:hypothetical protein
VFKPYLYLLVFGIIFTSCGDEPDEKIIIPFQSIVGNYEGSYYQCDEQGQDLSTCEYLYDETIKVNIISFSEISVIENNESSVLYYTGINTDDAYEFFDANDDASMLYYSSSKQIIYKPSQSFGLKVFSGLE